MLTEHPNNPTERIQRKSRKREFLSPLFFFLSFPSYGLKLKTLTSFGVCLVSHEGKLVSTSYTCSPSSSSSRHYPNSKPGSSLKTAADFFGCASPVRSIVTQYSIRFVERSSPARSVFAQSRRHHKPNGGGGEGD